MATFPNFFSLAAPASLASTYLMDNQTVNSSELPKMVLSSSAKKALNEVESWLSGKREQGRASFSCPPLRLSQRRYLSYAAGEAPSLGVSALSQGYFSGLIGLSRRLAFNSAKILFSSTELDHLIKYLFKVFEVLNFLDWAVGALAHEIKDCPRPRGPHLRFF